MIDKSGIEELLTQRIRETEFFLVEIHIGNANDIRVLIDSLDGVSIDQCVELSRWLTGHLEETGENYSLEVSSPGLGSPLMVRQQYVKNIGRDVEVLLQTGKKKKGKLLEVNDSGIEIETIEKMISGGSQKKKKEVKVNQSYSYEEIKSTKVIISF